MADVGQLSRPTRVSRSHASRPAMSLLAVVPLLIVVLAAAAVVTGGTVRRPARRWRTR